MRQRVDAHVLGCDLCRGELESIGATRTSLRALAPLRAPRPFAVLVDAPAGQSIRRGLGASPAVQPPRLAQLLGWLWRAGTLASAACLLLAIYLGAGPDLPVSGNRSPAARAPAPPEGRAQSSAAESGAVARSAPTPAQSPGAPLAAIGAGSGAATGGVPVAGAGQGASGAGATGNVTPFVPPSDSARSAPAAPAASGAPSTGVPGIGALNAAGAAAAPPATGASGSQGVAPAPPAPFAAGTGTDAAGAARDAAARPPAPQGIASQEQAGRSAWAAAAVTITVAGLLALASIAAFTWERRLRSAR